MFDLFRAKPKPLERELQEIAKNAHVALEDITNHPHWRHIAELRSQGYYPTFKPADDPRLLAIKWVDELEDAPGMRPRYVEVPGVQPPTYPYDVNPT